MQLLHLLGKKEYTKGEIALVVGILALVLYHLIPQLFELYANYPEFPWLLFGGAVVIAFLIEVAFFLYQTNFSVQLRRKITLIILAFIILTAFLQIMSENYQIQGYSLLFLGLSTMLLLALLFSMLWRK